MFHKMRLKRLHHHLRLRIILHHGRCHGVIHKRLMHRDMGLVVLLNERLGRITLNHQHVFRHWISGDESFIRLHNFISVSYTHNTQHL